MDEQHVDDYPTRPVELAQAERDAAADQWADNLYSRITGQIVALCERGCPPWTNPVGGRSMTVPHNARTGRIYGGINTLLLWAEAMRCGYDRAGWVTLDWLFKQQTTARLKVAAGWEGTGKTGQKPATVVFVDTKRVVKRTDAVTGEDAEVRAPVFKTYRVFNLCQIENLPDDLVPEVEPQPFDVTGLVLDEWIEQLGVNVVHGSAYPAYSRVKDIVLMPSWPQFTITDLRERAEVYQACLAHEVTHWTGAPHRLNRTKGKEFGDDAYAFEELVAEIGAAFICADFGIPQIIRHASYIDHWLGVLKRDKTAIVRAAKLAMDAKRWCDERTVKAAVAA